MARAKQDVSGNVDSVNVDNNVHVRVRVSVDLPR